MSTPPSSAASVAETPSTDGDSTTRNPQAEIALDAIHQGDCVELLAQLPDESVDLAFADPPFNIGFKYDEYDDRREDEHYLDWCEAWIGQMQRVVKPTGAFWLAIGDEYAAELKVAAKQLGFTPRNWVVWYYTFGQNCTRKFNRSHAHLFHFVKDEDRHTFNHADPAIRVPSARALVYGDRRANPTGRLPDDTWIVRPTSAPGMDWVLRPQDLRDDEAAFHPEDDTWYFSRVAGTFKERQGFHGCQMPEQLLGRIIRVSSSEGDIVLDPFAGSGTTLAVAKKLGRRWLGFELSSDYVKYATERIEAAQEGDDLHGPADPVRSAPTTAKGRRLKGHPLAKDPPPLEGEGLGEGSERPGPKIPGSTDATGSPRAEQSVSTADKSHPSPSPSPSRGGGHATATLRELTRRALAEAFFASHGGASLDVLLCRPELQAAFHAACEEAGLLGDPYQWNRQLLKLRKAGELKRSNAADQVGPAAHLQPAVSPSAFAAEIAWALVRAKHPGASLDDILCDPEKLALFDKEAAKASRVRQQPDQAAAELRWAALRLRKAAKTLKAESKQYDYVATKPIKQLVEGRLRKLTERAIKPLCGDGGVYFVTIAKKPEPESLGYVGEADDLGERLAAHLAAPLRGRAETFFAVIPDSTLPSVDYRSALRWNLTHRLRPTLSLDLLAGEGEPAL